MSAPIYGCGGCATTAGRSACPEHSRPFSTTTVLLERDVLRARNAALAAALADAVECAQLAARGPDADLWRLRAERWSAALAGGA